MHIHINRKITMNARRHFNFFKMSNTVTNVVLMSYRLQNDVSRLCTTNCKYYSFLSFLWAPVKKLFENLT